MSGKLPVVAIDGPVGSGKTTVARLAAKKLGYVLVDTGAIYRSVALKARQADVDWNDADRLGELAANLDIRFEEGRDKQKVFLDGVEVTDAIREPEISQGASEVSAHAPVRDALLDTQRDLGLSGGVVMEGRDIGTVVFPEAQVKAFVGASIEIRVQRRFEELKSKGKQVSLEDTLREVRLRDQRDEQRALAPLKPAEDAVLIDTGPLSAEEVADRVVALVSDFIEKETQIKHENHKS
ncbi:MAG: (d)CMP kinase [Deltaproteobacteria bacterium]|nr:(d)CMP kinase [Deltaproteobacteria bacterium]MBW1870447.1 (d)CMP kinase [Deltaproteobacteria bacterium]